MLDKGGGRMEETKQKYNQLLARIKKGEKWLGDETIDWQERWNQHDHFKALLYSTEEVLNKIKEHESVSSEQINDGFKEV